MDIRHDLEATFYTPLETIDYAALNAAYEDLENRARTLLKRDGAREDSVTIDRFAAMRYVGQSYEVTTPVPSGVLSVDSLDEISKAFYVEHEREYGVYSEEFPMAIVNLRVTAVGLTDKPSDDSMAGSASKEVSAPRERRVFFDGSYKTIPVFDSSSTTADLLIPGPAVVEQEHGVVFVPPFAEAHVDRYGHIIIEKKEVAA
jgi:N-methylhydantoinase A